jgi:hypothetical protein
MASAGGKTEGKAALCCWIGVGDHRLLPLRLLLDCGGVRSSMLDGDGCDTQRDEAKEIDHLDLFFCSDLGIKEE